MRHAKSGSGADRRHFGGYPQTRFLCQTLRPGSPPIAGLREGHLLAPTTAISAPPWWIRHAVPLALGVFALGFGLWWPDVITATDEGMYVYHAATLLQGQTHVPVLDPWTGATSWHLPAQYPLLTSLLQMPAMALAGWRGAYVEPLVGVLVTLLATAHWLRRWQLDPNFALLWLTFLPYIVLARLATSDVIGTAWVALSMAAFVEGQARDQAALRRGPWWLAGFLAGSSIAFREMGPLVPLVFFAGAVFRRQPGWFWLLIGGLVGVAVRPLSAWWAFDNPLFIKQSLPEWWGMRHLVVNFWPDVALLTFALPGGLPALLAYRGPLRVEMILAALLFIGLHMHYQFADGGSGWYGAVVGGRFFNLAVPLLIVAVAHAVKRLQAAGIAPRLWHWALRALVVGAVAVAAALHPAMAHWSRSHRQVQESFCQNVPPGAVAVVNTSVIGKYISPVTCLRTMVDLNPGSVAHMAKLMARNSQVYVGVVERTDSSFWRNWTETYLGWVEQLRGPYQLEPVYRGPDGWQRLQLWRVTAK